ncbi:wbpO, UDP-N-acetyl-D-galactosamine dehydrogenase [Nostoc flagelliforme CCNUN1]|uniref:WbpO, UDP-N-acetyl-D-galactosamine dehydrogenase n=1 Tax=Nostoc flagelliforme CCNUN1 TaxID=2038116 RepID=A0A2K8SMS7_9NOSO|nr:nucleotide sugar dehydrogenase [Nostoc flagelliforme]AUB36135.1 wbpO, UDP-N-acetyl-D-galactosamine dehydrogenase [Nostoc flagelliforme CCNUN1]
METIAVIGTGYVGLPLAVGLAKFYKVVAFDLNHDRIKQLRKYYDITGEVASEELLNVQNNLLLTTDEQDLEACNFFIIAVPTPINASMQPDLQALKSASLTVGRRMPTGSMVVIESTVFPGASQNVCLPLLEMGGKVYEQDFHLGYSPERVSPGDSSHSLRSVKKVVAGDCYESGERVRQVYQRVVDAGIYVAPSIQVAEACKLLENVQRDVNIALMNEVAKIFDTLGISTSEVLSAAKTKWNFAPFQPGLVGGHCIAVDPYYLIAIADENGLATPLLDSSRRVNESMSGFIAGKIFEAISAQGISIGSARVGILGASFKENVPDLRNSKVFDLVSCLSISGCEVLLSDPVCQAEEVFKHGFKLTDLEELADLDVLVLAVPHKDFLRPMNELLKSLRTGGLFVDLKGVFSPCKEVMPRQIKYWSL